MSKGARQFGQVLKNILIIIILILLNSFNTINLYKEYEIDGNKELIEPYPNPI